MNVGWKLALVCRGLATPALLVSYEAERRPVGEQVLRFTDRAFTAATSSGRAMRLVRRHVVARLAGLALRSRTRRAAAFRTISQLRIRYRHSPAVEPAPGFRSRSPRPGDRLPDARVSRDSVPCWLHEMLAAHTFHLLLAGRLDDRDLLGVARLTERHGRLLTVHRLDRDAQHRDLYDATGTALARLHVRGGTAFLVRPDGHVACRTAATDLGVVERYLDCWLTGNG